MYLYLESHTLYVFNILTIVIRKTFRLQANNKQTNKIRNFSNLQLLFLKNYFCLSTSLTAPAHDEHAAACTMVIPQRLTQCFPTSSQLNWQPESFVPCYLLLETQKMEIMLGPKAQPFFPALRSIGDMQCFGSQDLLQLLLVGDWKRLASSNIGGCYEDGFSLSLATGSGCAMFHTDAIVHMD